MEKSKKRKQQPKQIITIKKKQKVNNQLLLHNNPITTVSSVDVNQKKRKLKNDTVPKQKRTKRSIIKQTDNKQTFKPYWNEYTKEISKEFKMKP
jgi:hypothetical protein